MTRLLVTRPEPAASRTADKLRSKGYSVTILPLTRVVPLGVSEELSGGPFDAVAATSGNAVRHAPAVLLSSWNGLPAFAVGERTAQAFRDNGFARVLTSRPDASALAAFIVGHARNGMRLAYLCGHVRKPVFEARMRESGVRLTAIETYDAEIIRYDAGFLRKTLTKEPFDAVCLYSRRAAEAFAALLDSEQGESALFKGARFVCLSANIADGLPGKWKKRAVIAALPDESVLFDLLAMP